MKRGIYNGQNVKVYDNGLEFILVFEDETSIMMNDTSEIDFS